MVVGLLRVDINLLWKPSYSPSCCSPWCSPNQKNSLSALRSCALTNTQSARLPISAKISLRNVLINAEKSLTKPAGPSASDSPGLLPTSPSAPSTRDASRRSQPWTKSDLASWKPSMPSKTATSKANETPWSHSPSSIHISTVFINPKLSSYETSSDRIYIYNHLHQIIEMVQILSNHLTQKYKSSSITAHNNLLMTLFLYKIMRILK